MNLAWQNAWKHPGSTIKAALGLAIALTLAWMELPPKASFAVTVLALLRAALGFFQKDVGREETTQGMQDAHEVPNTGAPVAPKEAGQ